jgi:hypothetical protein
MRFTAKWIEERAITIYAPDIKAAEKLIKDTISKKGDPTTQRLLSIHRVDPVPMAPAPVPPRAA